MGDDVGRVALRTAGAPAEAVGPIYVGVDGGVVMEEVTKFECFTRFPDQWVCLEVLEQDEAGQTKRGRVVAHSPDEDEVLRAERDFRHTHQGITTLVFFAGPLVDPKSNVVVIL